MAPTGAGGIGEADQPGDTRLARKVATCILLVLLFDDPAGVSTSSAKPKLFPA